MDFEWAYNEIVRTHDLNHLSPGEVKSYVEGWREGFFSGFLEGYAEAKIEIASKLKQYGMETAEISECVGLSIDSINMIKKADAVTET